LRWIGCALVVVSATACGSRAGHLDIERSFRVGWHDRASSLDIEYTVARLAFHEGRWSAQVSIHNGSSKPLFEVAWDPDSRHITWYGPALVFSGKDVLGNRRLIYFPADREQPTIPLPLRGGATWRGTVGGELPDKPPIPRGQPIWFRYPMFGIGEVWDELNPALAVQWISAEGVTL
jgi:hypothetical protein